MPLPRLVYCPELAGVASYLYGARSMSCSSLLETWLREQVAND